MTITETDTVEPVGPPPHEVQEQLEHILSSDEFRLPQRGRNFLQFVVSETLAGRRHYLKAFTIAQSVFGRDANFDAQNDPCVRIEAGRIRRELEHYYLVAGTFDRIIITIPKGGYAPTFELNPKVQAPGTVGEAIATAQQTDPSTTAAGRDGRPPVRFHHWLAASSAAIAVVALAALLRSVVWPDASPTMPPEVDSRPSVLVERFYGEGGLAPDISKGIVEELVDKLSRFKEVVVVTTMPSTTPKPQYSLQGSVRMEGTKLRSIARLVRNADGAVVWANNYDADARTQTLLETERTFAEGIVTAVAGPFGAVFKTDANFISGSGNASSCASLYYRYRTEMTPEAHEEAKSCLQLEARHTTGGSSALGLLSLTLLDEFRFPFKLDTSPTPATLETAKQLAERAVQLDPRNARGFQALMLANFFANDLTAALRAGEAGYAINPNDTEVAGEYGLRLAMSGRWETGCELISAAVSKNAGPGGYYEVGMALCAFVRGDTQAAELWSRMSDLTYNPMHRLVLLSILGTLGKKAEAEEQLAQLSINSPALIQNVQREVVRRLKRPEDQERFLSGLRAAGLPVQDNQTLSN